MTMLAGIKNFMGIDDAHKHDLRHRLNLVAVAEAHIVWKTRLGHHVHGTIRESLDSAPLGQDGICQLGSWIRGSVLAPLCEPEVHRELSEAHEHFHQCGEHIIAKLKAGDRSDATAMFENEYNHALRRIIQALTIINKQLQDA